MQVSIQDGLFRTGHLGRSVGMMMVMRAGIDIHRDKIQLPMTHLRLRHQRVGECLHLRGWASKHDRLEAVFVVEVYVHRRQYQIVAGMLNGGEPFRQITGVMVVDVAQRGNAVGCLLPRKTLRAQKSTQNVANGFGPVLISLPVNQVIELPREIFAQRDRESLHGFRAPG